MAQITAEYIEQLKKETLEQLPGKVISNLKAQASRVLTSQQIFQLNNQINRIPLPTFVGYLMYGIINEKNLDLFTLLSGERKEIAHAFVNEAGSTPPSTETEQPAEPAQPAPSVQPSASNQQDEPKITAVNPVQPATSPQPVQQAAPIQQAASIQQTAQPVEAHTDVYLLGAPTTVKAFAAFIATVQQSKPDLLPFNVIELPGEHIAAKLADDRDCPLSFSDFGSAGSLQLQADRKKLLLIVLDATAESVKFNLLTSTTDEEGNVRHYSVHKFVNQTTLLRRLIELLSQPAGHAFLQQADVLHVISTRADHLGDGMAREEEALRRFRMLNKENINPLIELCRANGINVSTDGQPLLFTFGTGHAHEAADHQYHAADISKLTELLKGNTATIQK